jgi:hypothetical protein
MAARQKVWVIARGTGREETEEYLRQHPDAVHNVTVYYLPFLSASFSFPLWELAFYP